LALGRNFGVKRVAVYTQNSTRSQELLVSGRLLRLAFEDPFIIRVFFDDVQGFRRRHAIGELCNGINILDTPMY
jgi:hypothetical protein